MGTGRGAPAAAALDELPDAELVRLAGAGQQQAFEAIFARHGQVLFALCFALTPDGAQDLFAASVKRAVAGLHGGMLGDEALAPWLMRMAYEEAGAGTGGGAKPEAGAEAGSGADAGA